MPRKMDPVSGNAQVPRRSRSHSPVNTRQQKDGVYQGTDHFDPIFYWTDVWSHVMGGTVKLADFLAPRISLGFALFVGLIASFHEQHFVGVIGALICWLFTQSLRANFSVDWCKKNARFIVAQVLVYCFIGFGWTFIKLFMVTFRAETYGPQQPWHKEMMACTQKSDYQPACVIGVVDTYFKRDIAMWWILWPVNMLFTLSRDPLRIAYELSYKYVHSAYANVLMQAWNIAKSH